MQEWSARTALYRDSLVLPFAPIHNRSAQLVLERHQFSHSMPTSSSPSCSSSSSTSSSSPSTSSVQSSSIPSLKKAKLEGSSEVYSNAPSNSSTPSSSVYHLSQSGLTLRADASPNVSWILDFGTGPGQPAITIAEQIQCARLIRNNRSERRIVACDISRQMLLVAEIESMVVGQQNSTNDQCDSQIGNLLKFIQVSQNFQEATCTLTEAANGQKYSTIVSCLVLMYMSEEDRIKTLRMLTELLEEDGSIVLVFWGEKEEVAWLEVISRTLEKLGLGDRKCRETLQSGPSGGERGRKDNLSYDGSESDGIISPNSFAMASLEASERLAEAVNLEITHWEKRFEHLPFNCVETLLSFTGNTIPQHRKEEGFEMMKGVINELSHEKAFMNETVGRGSDRSPSSGMESDGFGVSGDSEGITNREERATPPRSARLISTSSSPDGSSEDPESPGGRFALPPSAVVYVVLKRKRDTRKRKILVESRNCKLDTCEK